jgi:hypothetical protein
MYTVYRMQAEEEGFLRTESFSTLLHQSKEMSHLVRTSYEGIADAVDSFEDGELWSLRRFNPRRKESVLAEDMINAE